MLYYLLTKKSMNKIEKTSRPPQTNCSGVTLPAQKLWTPHQRAYCCHRRQFCVCYIPEHYQGQHVDIEDSDIGASDPVQGNVYGCLCSEQKV